VVRDIAFRTPRSYGIEPDPDGLDRDVADFGQADGVLEYVAEIAGVVVGSVVPSLHASSHAEGTPYGGLCMTTVAWGGTPGQARPTIHRPSLASSDTRAEM